MALQKMAQILLQQNIPIVYFYESDFNGEMTAIATGTVYDRKPFRKLQLLQGA